MVVKPQKLLRLVEPGDRLGEEGVVLPRLKPQELVQVPPEEPPGDHGPKEGEG